MRHVRRRVRGRGPARLLAVLVGLALVAAPQTVSATWLQTGTGPADVKAGYVPGQAAPKAEKPWYGGTVVTVSWTVTTLPGNRQATGYVVRRSGTGSMSANSTCTGTTSPRGVLNVVTGTSCTDDRGLTGGTFTYTVQPVYEEWLGPASPASAAI